MLTVNNKVKLTLSVDEEVVKEAKERAKKMGVSLSRLVENFLTFYVKPTVYCFSCGKKFAVWEAEVCPKCGWFKCPHCGACGRDLGEEARKVAFEMRRVYDELLLGGLNIHD